jgi:hypothetical protein
MISTALLVVLVPPLGSMTNPIGRMISEPTWTLQTICISIGYQLYQRLPYREAFAVWFVPGLFLLVSAWNWHLTTSQYDSVWNTYFGKDCGGSECMYEALLTAPFYAGSHIPLVPGSPHRGLDQSGWTHMPEKSGGLNRSVQHWLGVYSPEFENPRSLAGVD